MAASIFIALTTISIILYYNSKKILLQKRKIPNNILKDLYLSLIEWYVRTSKDNYSDYAQLLLANKDNINILRLSRILRNIKYCPKDSESLSLYLSKLGLYEDVIMLSSKGCSISSSALMESRNALIALGITKWEQEASKKLGKDSILSNKVDLVSIYCSKNKIHVFINDNEIEIPPKGSEWRIGDPREGLELLLSSAKPSKVIYWGDCGKSLDAYLSLIHISSPRD